MILSDQQLEYLRSALEELQAMRDEGITIFRAFGRVDDNDEVVKFLLRDGDFVVEIGDYRRGMDEAVEIKDQKKVSDDLPVL